MGEHQLMWLLNFLGIYIQCQVEERCGKTFHEVHRMPLIVLENWIYHKILVVYTNIGAHVQECITSFYLSCGEFTVSAI